MKIAFLFPGQGSQYPGMGKDFLSYSTAKLVFEEADDILHKNLSKIIFEGPESLLTETINSQLAIFITSVALLRTIQKQFPEIHPSIVAGLSLGEYTALYSANYLSFSESLQLVAKRAQFMQESCKSNPGSMAVILGLNADQVEELVKKLNMPKDLWAANFNCPGQVVISGTNKGLEKGINAALTAGAKRAIKLQVSGAFHSGLMRDAETKLASYILETNFLESSIPLVMNATATSTNNLETISANLIRQITQPVFWEQSIRLISENDIDFYLEIGPGKTLSGFNKRIGVNAPTISIEKTEDLKTLDDLLTQKGFK